MAFDKNNLSLIGGAPPGAAVYSYVTTDSKTVVTSIGYFNSAFGTFNVDDLILVNNNDGSFTLRVTSVGKASVVVEVVINQSSSDVLQKTSAQELSVAETTTITQISAQYGIGEDVSIITETTGTVTSQGTLFVADTGTAADGIAVAAADRQLTYRPGQGIVSRIRARFTQGVIGSLQTAGVFNAENGLGFGYLNDVFGIVYGSGGAVENQELTITTSAAGAETATVTVNGVAYSVPLTAGTAQLNANEIANSLNAQVPSYNFSANNNQVVALAEIPGPAGAFAFTSSTAVAAWTQVTAGIDINIQVLPQANWNLNPLAGDFTLDPQKLNGYQIKYSFSGALFSVMNDSGEIIDVHYISAANSDAPYITTPAFSIGWVVRNLGNTTNIVVSGESCSGFVEGRKRFDAGIRGDVVTAPSIGTTPTAILSIRNRLEFGMRINRAELLPRFVSSSTDTNKSMFFNIYINPTFTTDPIFQYVDKDNSIAEISKDAITVTGGRLIGGAVATLGASESVTFNSQPNTDTFLSPGDTIVIVANVSSGAASEASVTGSWQEDI